MTPAARIDQMHRVTSIRSGDTRAIGELLEALIPVLRTRLHRLLGPSSDLDDVLQDTLIEIAKALPKYEGRSSVTTYAHRIMLRCAYKHFSTRKRRHALSLELVPSSIDDIDPESRSIHREALRRLYRCLDSMSEKRRVTFVLCDVEGMTPSEVAKIEQVPALVIRARLMHARSEVSARLGKDPLLQSFVRPAGEP